MRRMCHVPFLALGVVAVVAYFVVPHDSSWPSWIYQLLGAAAIVAIVSGVQLHRPNGRGAWYALAAAVGCFFLGDAVWTWYDLRGVEPPLVSIADVFYLSGYPALGVAVVLFVRSRRPGRDLETLIDGTVLALAGSTYAWIWLVRPVLGDAGGLVEMLVTAAYPVSDIVLLGVLAHLVFAPGTTSRSFALLVGGLVLTLIGDSVYLLQVNADSYTHHSWVDANWLLGYLCFGAAALHPSMTGLTDPTPREGPSLTSARIGLLAVALLTLPIVAIFGRVDMADRLILGVGAVGVVVLVLLRTTVVVTAKEREIIERRRAEAELADRATHDPLTRLLTRDAFLDRVSNALARARRTGESVAVLFLDLDDFKVVNDSLGHDAGDQVLRVVAARLSAVLREGDVLARFGGDEFTVLCEHVRDHSDAQIVAERAAASVSQVITFDDNEIALGISTGIVVAHRGEADASHLLRDADVAMYRAKSRGRNLVAVFDENMRSEAVDRFDVQNRLRRATTAGELRLEFQPQVELATGRLFGLEALLRWDHPIRGTLTPDAFIDVAEQTGLVVPIGEWAIEAACAQLAEWDALLPVEVRPTMAVNLSSRQLAQPDLIVVMARGLANAGVDPRRLCVEITERALLTDPDLALETLSALKDQGVSVAVDDFGTGYFSLAQIKHFPIDMLKVDRSFVQGLGVDASDEAIVAATVGLAHALGLVAVAEGVETVDQLRMLRGLGCDIGQGYAFSRPRRPADLLTRLAVDDWRSEPGRSEDAAWRALVAPSAELG